jgi:hypothetical protein
MLAVAAALARAFPAVPLLARAAAELAVLAEMTVGGPAAIARIQRLLAPPARESGMSAASAPEPELSVLSKLPSAQARGSTVRLKRAW